MTFEEKSEFREMITDIYATHNAKIDGKFNVIRVELAAIKEQTTKTNGRVTKLEDKIETKITDKISNIDNRIEILKTNDIEHILHCPNISKIQELENQQLSRKSITKFMLIMIATISTIFTIALALFKLFGGNPTGG
jgi:predicted nuclease with TOPRIM domain